jgi:anti-sigma factor RsiW
MTPCAQFEEHLLDYDELSLVHRAALDAHLATCSACREFRTALERADAALETSLGSVHAPLRVKHAVLAQVRPSALPEVLDGIGWIGSAAVGAVAAYFVAGPFIAALIAGTGSLMAAGWFSVRSLRTPGR